MGMMEKRDPGHQGPLGYMGPLGPSGCTRS